MTKISLILLILTLISCKTEDIVYRTLDNTKSKNLKGNIKSVTYYKTIYPSSETDITENKLEESVLEEFNTNGDLLKKIYFGDDGAITDEFINKYDKNNNLVRSDVLKNGKYIRGFEIIINNEERTLLLTWYDENKKITSSEIYNYDNKGNRIKITEFNASSKISAQIDYMYDKHGNSTQSITTNPRNGKKSKTLYKYNSLNLKTEIQMFNEKEERTFKTANQYDKSGNLTAEIRFNDDGSEKSKIVYTYNDNNDKESRITKYEFQDKNKVDFNYRYDANGNWTYKEDLNRGRVTSIENRLIKYY